MISMVGIVKDDNIDVDIVRDRLKHNIIKHWWKSKLSLAFIFWFHNVLVAQSYLLSVLIDNFLQHMTIELGWQSERLIRMYTQSLIGQN